jgi:hypothetical protein
MASAGESNWITTSTRADAQALFLVALHVRGDRGGDLSRIVLELAQREQQAGRKAVGDAGGQQARGIGPGIMAQRRRLVGQQRRDVLVEADQEGEVFLLFEGEAELLRVAS